MNSVMITGWWYTFVYIIQNDDDHQSALRVCIHQGTTNRSSSFGDNLIQKFHGTLL